MVARLLRDQVFLSCVDLKSNPTSEPAPGEAHTAWHTIILLLERQPRLSNPKSIQCGAGLEAAVYALNSVCFGLK